MTDALVYVQTAGITGTATVTIGPSTGAANSILNRPATLGGASDLLTVQGPGRVGSIVTLTGIGAAMTQTTVVTC